MAPEVVLQDYDEQADVWSVGILMWQLLTGRFPFWDDIKSLSLQQVRAPARRAFSTIIAGGSHVCVCAENLLVHRRHGTCEA